ncbi:MAG: CAP domain-containing protein [Anaerolineales bacterium]|nr:CAP domain-containing protein [Anaerolineales bacterium]
MRPSRITTAKAALLSALWITACSRASAPAPPLASTSEAQPAASTALHAGRPEQLSEEQMMPAAIGVVSAANVLRIQAGLPPLTASGTLMGLALARAQGMTASKYLGHEDPSGASPSAQELLQATGFRGPVGELVYGSQRNLEGLAADAVRAWEASPANRELLLSSKYRYAGVGIQGDGNWWKVSLLLAASEP